MRLAAAYLALCLSGCSFVFVHGPPAGHEQLRYFDCVSSAAAPVADGSWAVAEGVAVAALASSDDTGPRNDGAAIAFAASLGALHAASAIYGVVHAGACSDAKQHLQQRIADDDVAKARLIDDLRRKNSGQSPARTEPAATASPPLPSPYVEAAPSPHASPHVDPAPAPLPSPYVEPESPASVPAAPPPAQ